MEAVFQNIGLAAGVLFAAVCYGGIVFRLLKQKRSMKKTVDAVLVNKQQYTQQMVSRAQGVQKAERYVLTFSAQGRRLDFYVSAPVYESCALEETGVLVYQGERFISFDRV